MSFLRLNAVTKRFGETVATENLDLAIDRGEFVVLVGPSGCGKTTILRIVAGLETPDDGTLELEGRDITAAPPRERAVAMVFQSYALYPHMTVRRNLSFGLGWRGRAQEGIASRIADVARTLDLTTVLDRYPSQLSGGQQQRVAVGRAIVRKPSLFLLDEPLSNLDAERRVSMRAELRRLHESLRTTTLYVTHDQVEAMTLGDRIVVLNHGRVEQIGSPDHVYQHPASVFVGRFLGSPQMNVFDVDVRRDKNALVATIHGREVVIPADRLLESTSSDLSRATAGIRPECLRVTNARGVANDVGAGIRGAVEIVERVGKEHVLLIRCHRDGHELVFQAVVPPESPAEKGDAVCVDFSDEAVLLFDAESGETLLNDPAKQSR